MHIAHFFGLSKIHFGLKSKCSLTRQCVYSTAQTKHNRQAGLHPLQLMCWCSKHTYLPQMLQMPHTRSHDELADFTILAQHTSKTLHIWAVNWKATSKKLCLWRIGGRHWTTKSKSGQWRLFEVVVGMHAHVISPWYSWVHRGVGECKTQQAVCKRRNINSRTCFIF